MRSHFTGVHNLPFSKLIGSQPRSWMRAVLPHLYLLPKMEFHPYRYRQGTWLTWTLVRGSSLSLVRSWAVHFATPSVELREP